MSIFFIMIFWYYFIKLKRKKGYVQLIEKETLEENTGIELTETKPEEEVATD